MSPRTWILACALALAALSGCNDKRTLKASVNTMKL
jgi:hypothetical protein